MPAPLSKILRPVFLGFQVTTLAVTEPRVDWFSVDPASVPVRWGDPVKQVAGGNIVRCVPTDTSLLGIAAGGTNNVMPVSIAQMPLPVDSLGRPKVPVYKADALTLFRGQCSTAPAQSALLQTHDLQYAVPDGSTVLSVTPVGTAGSTTYSYTATALTANGENVPGAATTTTTGNATLSATNYNQVAIGAQPAGSLITSYGIYRGTSLIGMVPINGTSVTTFNDTGQAAISVGANTVNMTGWAINLSGTSTNVIQVQSLDTTPVPPLGAAPGNGVLFTIPAAKSQIGNVSGS